MKNNLKLSTNIIYCIIYCRVSSKDQVEGTSLETQERLAREFAEKQGFVVLKVFIERGESAKTADRTEFNKALTFCTDKRNNVNYFIVYKIDRFARNQDDHAIVRGILKRSGVELKSVTEPIDQTSVGRAMEGMLSVFAEFDNNVRTERTKGGMLERLKQGIWVWQAPLGYYRPAKGSNIVPEIDRSVLIRLIFEEWSKGVYTFQSLADYMADRGLKTRAGKRPGPQLIEKILRNPVYCGIIRIDGWGEFEGVFEPVVSKELFIKCQKGESQAIHVAARSANNVLFPLRGSQCTLCHGTITGSTSTNRKKQKYDYYHHVKNTCEKAHSIPKENFEQQFIEYLECVTPSSKYEKLFKAVVIDNWKSNYHKFYDIANRIRKEIDHLEQERLKIFDFHRSGKYTDEEFLEQKQILNETINQKRLLMQEQSVEEFDMEAVLEYVFTFVRTTAKTWIEAEYPDKLRFQKIVCKKKIEFDGEKFRTAELSQVYAINQEYDGEKSCLVAPTGIEPVLPH